MSGIFYSDITDHLPCFLSIKIKLSNNLKDDSPESLATETVQDLLKLWGTEIGIQCLKLKVTGRKCQTEIRNMFSDDTNLA